MRIINRQSVERCSGASRGRVVMNRCRLLFLKSDWHSPVKDSGLLQHISQVDVGVQEVRVQGDRLLEVMDGEPDLSLCIEHTAKVAPCNGEVGTRLYGLKVASLEAREGRTSRESQNQ